MVDPIIEVTVVTYRQYGHLEVLIQCFLNQTAPNWRMTVIHDGPDAKTRATVQRYARKAAGRLAYHETEQRQNDWGHSSRSLGVEQATGDWLLLTNGDNYYVPCFVELITQVISEHSPDVVLFDMVHSHNQPGGRPAGPYSFFPTEYSRNNIDIGAAVVRSDLAKSAGFRGRGYAADADYFEDVAAAAGGSLRIAKASAVLFVHN